MHGLYFRGVLFDGRPWGRAAPIVSFFRAYHSCLTLVFALHFLTTMGDIKDIDRRMSKTVFGLRKTMFIVRMYFDNKSLLWRQRDIMEIIKLPSTLGRSSQLHFL